jgi:putative lipoic acid-binding regulatory protein
MILDKNSKEKPKIEYPTEWSFTVIGRDKGKVEDAIKDILQHKEHSCKFSKVSKNGKFTSYSAKCVVDSQDERDKIYKTFSNHSDVDYVM